MRRLTVAILLTAALTMGAWAAQVTYELPTPGVV